MKNSIICGMIWIALWIGAIWFDAVSWKLFCTGLVFMWLGIILIKNGD